MEQYDINKKRGRLPSRVGWKHSCAGYNRLLVELPLPPQMVCASPKLIGICRFKLMRPALCAPVVAPLFTRAWHPPRRRLRRCGTTTMTFFLLVQQDIPRHPLSQGLPDKDGSGEVDVKSGREGGEDLPRHHSSEEIAGRVTSAAAEGLSIS